MRSAIFLCKIHKNVEKNRTVRYDSTNKSERDWKRNVKDYYTRCGYYVELIFVV